MRGDGVARPNGETVGQGDGNLYDLPLATGKSQSPCKGHVQLRSQFVSDGRIAIDDQSQEGGDSGSGLVMKRYR